MISCASGSRFWSPLRRHTCCSPKGGRQHAGGVSPCGDSATGLVVPIEHHRPFGERAGSRIERGVSHDRPQPAGTWGDSSMSQRHRRETFLGLLVSRSSKTGIARDH